MSVLQENHVKLYKSAPTNIKQSERRRQLLSEQKKQRNGLVDNLRNIQKIVEHLQRPKRPRRKQDKQDYRNYLQLSEWMKDKPDDLDNWYLVPCPQGSRCIVVATGGITQVYTKYGVFQNKFHSSLSGDKKNRQNVTILDCIYCVETEIYYVLDLIAYANQEFNQCDVTFRFFWIASKIQEEQLDHVDGQNKYAFKSLRFFDCADETAIAECLAHYPLWDNNQPQLDGLLFYHKESTYVNGTTPLVTWLFPFMVPEMLNVPHINAQYILEAPAGYVNCKSYIDKFDEALKNKKKRNRRRTKSSEKMEADTNDDDEQRNTVDAIINTQMTLELEGECNDDQDYRTMDE